MMPKALGIVGLGKMGGGIAMQLLEKDGRSPGSRATQKRRNISKKG